ncbi:MAG: glycine cleavage system protein H [Candidatus Rokubacteria bacterium GWC2_70_16]|nr:MAG: glycine cleavage system protein H [Candidatus Rokubacteria bacterium GWC2_70_16]OGL13798.1 MAG: glycine cleavage system protein H [Candidatus Rokubacteria bacterium RIFCSPLOWO2_12_FULL_71_19]
MALYRGCDLPEDLWYDVDRDVWARFEEDGTATLGMTDPAQTRCGPVVSVRLKAVGRRVPPGQSLGTIESAKWVGPFPAVLSGVIVANNEAAFRRDILVANRDPYGEGWLVRLRPERLPEERGALVTGAEALARYRARIDANAITCMRCEG